MIKRITIFASIYLLFSCSLVDSSFLSNIGFSKNLDEELLDSLIDQNYIDHLYELVPIINENYRDNNKKFAKIAQSYYQEDSIKFRFLYDFYTIRSKAGAEFMTRQYLKKPAFNDMLAIYLQGMIGLNEFYKSSGIIEEKDTGWQSANDVVAHELKTLTSSHTLINLYYNHVFSNGEKLQPPSNIDFIELGLTKEESSILFYHFTSTYGSSIRTELKKNTKVDCIKINKIASKFPTFNGQHFSKFQVSPLKNFRTYNTKRGILSNYGDYNHSKKIKTIIKVYNDCNN